MAAPVLNPAPTAESKKERETRERRERDTRDADMDRKMREAAERFKRSKESDTPGYKKGGSVSSASKRADGCATKGKTRGKFV
jgi:hypothetical protein